MVDSAVDPANLAGSHVTGVHEPAEGGQGASNYCGHVLDKALSDHDLIRKVSPPTAVHSHLEWLPADRIRASGG